jgi:hypothetical protein
MVAADKFTIILNRCNPLRYIPVLWAAVLSLSLYFLVSILLTIRTLARGSSLVSFSNNVGLQSFIDMAGNGCCVS